MTAETKTKAGNFRRDYRRTGRAKLRDNRTSRLLRIRVSDDALDVMRRDALRRKIPYSQVMGEALERHAAELSGNSESG